MQIWNNMLSFREGKDTDLAKLKRTRKMDEKANQQVLKYRRVREYADAQKI